MSISEFPVFLITKRAVLAVFRNKALEISCFNGYFQIGK